MYPNMKRLKSTITIGLLICMLMPVGVMAVNPSQRNRVDVIWSSRTNSRGLYTRGSTTANYVSNGLTISVAALYYYGDVDLPGIAFNGGFQTTNLFIGGTASFAYTMPLTNHCNWRFGLSLGALRGDNRGKQMDDSGRLGTRMFRSFFFEPAAGIEYYPFSRAGFYLYAGVALNASIILRSSYNGVEGNPFGILPMIPLEIGYDFRLGRSWLLRIYANVHQGIVDVPYMNLDGFPISKGEGTGGGNKWADGYFSVGLSLSYKWHNCEKCRQYKW